MSKIKPLVSIVTPCYNSAKFLVRAVESVKNQCFNVEHIIVDDCSTDNSWDILLDLSRKYYWIKLIRLEKNSGPVIARNTAVKSAQGKFLAFLDADDYWLPNKLNLQINFMEQTNAAISYSDCKFISEDGQLIGRRLSGLNKIGIHLHFTTRFVACLTVIINREIYREFYFPDISPAIRAEDFIAWLRVITAKGPALRCPYDLARYSVVMNSRSSKKIIAGLTVWKLYRNILKLPLILAGIYYFLYAIFAIWKKIYFRPQFNAAESDSKYARYYRI
jgi:teichuronic acid biosynthesis glycosyltransferase TuaG